MMIIAVRGGGVYLLVLSMAELREERLSSSAVVSYRAR